jgi:hypothetical protein
MHRALLIVAVLALPVTASGGGWVSVSGGVYVPTSTVGGVSWKAGMTGSIQGGYDLEYLGASLSVGVLSTDVGPSLWVTAWPIVLRLRARLPVGFADPYVFGGVGVAPSRANLSAFQHDAAAFTAQAGVGVDFTLGDMFLVGAEAGYAWLRPDFSFGTLSLDGFVGRLAFGVLF